MTASPFDYEAALLACARGDQKAFQRLYEHEAPRMLALGLSLLGQRAAAEELVCDTFVLVWKNAENFDEVSGKGRAWLYSILRYRALKRLRQSSPHRSKNTPSSESLPVLKPEPGQPPSSLLSALTRLDESQRQPILMAFYKGYSYEQIATTLKISPVQARMRAQVGLSHLRELRQA